jgi:hypothetical protein
MAYHSPFVYLRRARQTVIERLLGERSDDPDDQAAKAAFAEAEKQLISSLRDGALPARGELLCVAGATYIGPYSEGLVQVAYPKPTISQPISQIGADWWGSVGLGVEINWLGSSLSRQKATGNEFILRIEVKKSDLDRLWIPPSSSTKRKGGRPREHDWNGAREFARRYYAEHPPLPPIKKRAIELVTGWFEKNHPPAPGPREIAREVVDALYAGK